MKPGERYCPICRYWDGHEQDCPERASEQGPGSPWLARGQCTRCRHIFDSASAEVVARYADCSVFKCPRCNAAIDDRPIGWGGSFRPLGRP